MSYSEIATLVGISRVAVRKRVEAMEKKGIIKGYTAVICPEKASQGTKFIIDIETTPEYYEEIAEYLSNSRYIRQIYSLSGPCSLHAVGYVAVPANLQPFANALFRSAKQGIVKMSCRTILSTIMDRDGGEPYERYKKHRHLEDLGAETGQANACKC